MMLVVLALFIWFALSVPATLFIGRIIASDTRGSHAPFPARMAASGHSLLRR